MSIILTDTTSEVDPLDPHQTQLLSYLTILLKYLQPEGTLAIA